MTASSVAVCMTVFNRSATTERCLESLLTQAGVEETKLRVYVVDDGSSDGTGEMLKKFADRLDMRIIDGKNLYWCKGMHLAMKTAVEDDPDFVLWVNDDVDLVPTALQSMLEESERAENQAVVAGRTRASNDDTETYGGWSLRDPRRPMTVVPYTPGDTTTELAVVNGNAVLIPRVVYRKVGLIDDEYSHGYGDYDYSFRARAMGVPLRVVPEFVGVCDLNDNTGTWKDGAVPPLTRLRLMLDPKGMPPHDVVRYLRLTAPRTWPLQVAREYAGVFYRFARKRNYY